MPEASVSKVCLKLLSVKLVGANLWISIFALKKVCVQLPKILTRLFSFIVSARFQCAFARYRVRSNCDTLCRRCLDILSIEFAVCNPFQCEIIPLSISFDQLIPEAEVSNAESKSKNKLRPSKQPFHPSNLHSLCQADFKGGATGEKTWSLGRCMLGEFEFFEARHSEADLS